MEFSSLFKLPYFSKSMIDGWINNYTQLLTNPHNSIIANLTDFGNVKFISSEVILDYALLNDITDSLLSPHIGYSGKKIYLAPKTTFKIIENNKEVYSKSITLNEEKFSENSWTVFLSEIQAQYILYSSEKTSCYLICDFSFLKEAIISKIKEIKETLEKKLPEDDKGNLMGLSDKYVTKDNSLDEETKEKFTQHINTYIVTQRLDELVYALRTIHAF